MVIKDSNSPLSFSSPLSYKLSFACGIDSDYCSQCSSFLSDSALFPQPAAKSWLPFVLLGPIMTINIYWVHDMHQAGSWVVALLHSFPCTVRKAKECTFICSQIINTKIKFHWIVFFPTCFIWRPLSSLVRKLKGMWCLAKCFLLMVRRNISTFSALCSTQGLRTWKMHNPDIITSRDGEIQG